MVNRCWRGDNRGVMEQRHAAPELKTPRRPSRIVEMQRLLDDRDETIRLLNEALSRALDDLRLKAA